VTMNGDEQIHAKVREMKKNVYAKVRTDILIKNFLRSTGFECKCFQQILSLNVFFSKC